MVVEVVVVVVVAAVAVAVAVIVVYARRLWLELLCLDSVATMSEKQLRAMHRLRAAEAQLESLYARLDSKCSDLQSDHAETIAEAIDTCIGEVQDEIHALLEGHMGGIVASNMLVTYAEGAAQLPPQKRPRLDVAAPEAPQVLDGRDGSDGVPGSRGSVGAARPAGRDGVNGYVGRDGSDGARGSQRTNARIRELLEQAPEGSQRRTKVAAHLSPRNVSTEKTRSEKNEGECSHKTNPNLSRVFMKHALREYGENTERENPVRVTEDIGESLTRHSMKMCKISGKLFEAVARDVAIARMLRRGEVTSIGLVKQLVCDAELAMGVEFSLLKAVLDRHSDDPSPR